MLKQIGFVTSGAFILFFLFGPGYYLMYAPTIQPVVDIDIQDTEQIVSEKIHNLPDLRPGNESQIIWVAESGNKTAKAILYLHGFSAGPQEVQPLISELARSLSANSYLPLLPGHGRLHDQMEKLTADQLFQEAVESYQIARSLGDEVLVIGTSTGAALALWLAERGYKIDGLILLSPNLGIRDPRGFLAAGPLGYWVLRMVVGSHYRWTPKYENQAQFWTTEYEVNGIRVMTDIVNESTQLSFRKINIPTLTLWTAQDTVVNVEKSLSLLRQMPSEMNKTVEVKSRDHVLAGDITSPETNRFVHDEILQFINQL